VSPILMLCSLVLVLPRCSNGADTTILADYLQEGLFDPAGDSRMFVMQFDVTGDGRPELFLAASAAGSSAGMPWTLYSPGADGTYRRLGDMTFNYEAFHYSSSDSVLRAYVRLGARVGGYAHYRVSADGIQELQDESDEQGDAAKVASWKAKGERPKLYWAMLSALRNPAPVEWREHGTNKNGPDLGRLDASAIP
jgi:hypothetical protein